VLLADRMLQLAQALLREMMMIRCSGLLIGRWMFLPWFGGRKRKWRR
jgi:hypothetical protein